MKTDRHWFTDIDPRKQRIPISTRQDGVRIATELCGDVMGWLAILPRGPGRVPVRVRLEAQDVTSAQLEADTRWPPSSFVEEETDEEEGEADLGPSAGQFHLLPLILPEGKPVVLVDVSDVGETVSTWLASQPLHYTALQIVGFQLQISGPGYVRVTQVAPGGEPNMLYTDWTVISGGDEPTEKQLFSLRDTKIIQSQNCLNAHLVVEGRGHMQVALSAITRMIWDPALHMPK